MKEDSNNSYGIYITKLNNEIVIKGKKEDLEELVKYINMIITSNIDKNHIHLDEATLINDNSEIKELIIEKI